MSSSQHGGHRDEAAGERGSQACWPPAHLCAISHFYLSSPHLPTTSTASFSAPCPPPSLALELSSSANGARPLLAPYCLHCHSPAVNSNSYVPLRSIPPSSLPRPLISPPSCPRDYFHRSMFSPFSTLPPERSFYKQNLAWKPPPPSLSTACRTRAGPACTPVCTPPHFPA